MVFCNEGDQLSEIKVKREVGSQTRKNVLLKECTDTEDKTLEKRPVLYTHSLKPPSTQHPVSYHKGEPTWKKLSLMHCHQEKFPYPPRSWIRLCRRSVELSLDWFGGGYVECMKHGTRFLGKHVRGGSTGEKACYCDLDSSCFFGAWA